MAGIASGSIGFARRVVSRSLLVAGLLLSPVVAEVAAAVAAGADRPPAPASRLEPLGLHTPAGHFAFRVERATTPEERTRGLMHRRFLAADQGMLFDFGQDQVVSMWMKNTLIPLDMLFITADGLVVAVEAMAMPGDLTPRGPGQPVRAVLELPGGTAARLSVVPGSRVEHGLFAGR